MTLVPNDFYKALPFWTELSKEEQQSIKTHTGEFLQARQSNVESRLAMARSLYELQSDLEGRGLFIKYLEENLDYSYRTAYRLIEGWKRVSKQLPEKVLDGAMERGMDILGYQASKPFGPYTAVIKELPPPKTGDVAKYLQTVEERRKALPSPQKAAKAGRKADPAAALVGAYRSASSWYRRIGLTGKARGKWAAELLSYLMAEFGLPAQRIEPAAAPEGFKAVLGRPKLKTRLNS